MPKGKILEIALFAISEEPIFIKFTPYFRHNNSCLALIGKIIFTYNEKSIPFYKGRPLLFQLLYVYKRRIKKRNISRMPRFYKTNSNSFLHRPVVFAASASVAPIFPNVVIPVIRFNIGGTAFWAGERWRTGAESAGNRL